MQDAALVLLDDVNWVARAPSNPEQVQLQVHEIGIGLVRQNVEGGPRRVVGQPEELPVVIVVAKLQSRPPGLHTGLVQVAHERPPRRGGASHLTDGEVDPEERVHDVGRPQSVASASEPLQAAGSNGCGMRTWPDVATMPLASNAAWNSWTVRPTKPAVDPRVSDLSERGDRPRSRWRAGYGARAGLVTVGKLRTYQASSYPKFFEAGRRSR